jgi:enamine deaminase RidA (YjgF/YER057c/UK114 family)
MSLEKIDPDTLAPPHGHCQIVVAQGRIVYSSGQIGIDTEENLHGADPVDYAVQAERTLLNVYKAIEAAGGTPADIARLMVYVANATQENLEEVYAGIGKAFASGGGRRSAMTLLGVSGFSHPGAVVEMDATAVID